MKKLHKPNPNRKQLLYFAKDELHEDYFAAIRITWFSIKGACAVSELLIKANDIAAISEFPYVIKEALCSGADVSIVSHLTSESLGIHEL